MPSSRKAKDALVKTTVEELRQVKTNSAVVIETGSGWGGVALSLAARLPQSKIQGYENSPFPYLISRLRAKLAGYDNLNFRFGDYRRAPLASSDILVCYLFPGGMQDIAKLKLTGPVIISNTFALPDHTPDRRIQSGDTALSIIYVYRPEQLR
ncbi:MAG: class I SAM-dependent methyltransferase [Spirochaetia bacterium]|nr:class I SAM-dependent methyltransferase [Spirochaetia bacterium]